MINTHGLTTEQISQVIKRALSTAVTAVISQRLASVLDDQFNHYCRAWETTFEGEHAAQVVERTAYGYKDIHGITKYYSQTVEPWIATFTAGGNLGEGMPVYINPSGEAVRYK